MTKPAAPHEDEEPAPLRRYRELTRYPSSTRRITEDSFDLLNPGARHERRMPIPDQQNNPDHAWQVRFTADRYFVRDAQPALLSLELWHEGRARLPTSVEMIAEPIGDGATGGAIPLDLATSGTGVQSTFVPNDHWPALVGQIRVTTIFTAEGLSQQTGSLDFYFTGADRIPARFTGEFADRPLRGDLVVEVGVDVDKPGRYRVEGNLADATGRPFGWARFDGDLAGGVQSLPLVFYGLVFHDAEATPPFTLQQVRGYRARRGDVPHREDMATYSGEYRTTSPYTIEDFRTEENDSPRKRRMIAMYQDALDRGVRLTTPEYVGAAK